MQRIMLKKSKEVGRCMSLRSITSPAVDLCHLQPRCLQEPQLRPVRRVRHADGGIAWRGARRDAVQADGPNQMMQQQFDQAAQQFKQPEATEAAAPAAAAPAAFAPVPGGVM